MTPFGCYLEKLRRSRGLQQKQLAALLDIDPAYVSLLEKGRKGPPSAALLEQLIQQLKLNIEEQALLEEYVAQSPRTLTLPENMGLEEYALLRQLWLKLGSLSGSQVEIIQKVLGMSDEVHTAHPSPFELRECRM